MHPKFLSCMKSPSADVPEDVMFTLCLSDTVQGCHGQGKVREFCKKSGKISVLVKVREKSGNFVFRLAQGFVKIMKTFSFGKLSCSRSSGASYVFKCKVFGQWFSL